jgi:D-aminoacyl-tRNA deacylase
VLPVNFSITKYHHGNDLAIYHFSSRSRKILNIRLFEAEGQRWQTNVVQEKLEILCVSQFTLYQRLKGNKPDFHMAMQGEEAKKLYDLLLKRLGDGYEADKIKNGKFGAFMQVHIQNDGPVTLEIESPPKEEKVEKKTKVQVVNPIVS